ncbi:MAG: hypothetical protein ACKOQ4_06395 [Mycobacterium sp.]
MAASTSSSRRGAAVAAFALMAGALPAALLATSPAETAYRADCAVGFYWDTVNMVCAPVVVDPVPVVDPVLGPVGPVGVGGVVGPVGVDPVLGPVGPVGVGRR